MILPILNIYIYYILYIIIIIFILIYIDIIYIVHVKVNTNIILPKASINTYQCECVKVHIAMMATLTSNV